MPIYLQIQKGAWESCFFIPKRWVTDKLYSSELTNCRLIAACWQFVCIYKLDQSNSDHSCLDTGCLSPGDLCIRPVKVIPQRLRVLNVHSLTNQLVAATTCSWLPNAKKSHPITQPSLIFFQVVRRLASYFYSVVTELFKEGGRELKCDPKHQGIR